MMCLRMDLYAHESECPYSLVNQGGAISQNGALSGSQEESPSTSQELKSLRAIVNNLTALVKSQDEKIKELKLRVENLEDGKLNNMIDLSKLNHNSNTQLNLDRLSAAQIPESKGWFGAQHYDKIQENLEVLKDFYEHPDWKLCTNLGLTQLYLKKEEDEKVLSVLCRTEINHRISDISEEVYGQKIFMNSDSHIKHSEVIQKIGDGINLHYMQFNKFLISSESDAIFISQKIEYEDESGLETVVFPIISVKNSRKKVTEEFERLEFIIGGWVLKALGTTKTLVNVFYKVKYDRSEIPETFVSKNAKSMMSMIRTLEQACNKNFVNYRFGSKIFEKTMTILSNEDAEAVPVYEEAKQFRQKNKQAEEAKEEVKEILETPTIAEIKEGENGIIVPTPSDVPDLDPGSVNQEYKEYILETRNKLKSLIKMVNEGKWK